MAQDPDILKAHKDELLEEERQELQPWGWVARFFFLLGVFFMVTVVSAQAILIVPRVLAPAPVERLQERIASVFPFSLLPRANSYVLKGEENDRVNMLVTGIGGVGHDGPYLTDTILVASFQPSTNTVALLSIPRDLFIPEPAPGGRKINAVGALEEARVPGSGNEALAKTLEHLLGITIPYQLRVDFEGFATLIDRLGGIDVVVDRSFEDHHYPILGKEDAPNLAERYETLKVEAGPQHFDGHQALRYARSRYGNNGEGSDFARMRRQQKMIAALKEKILQPSILRPRSLSALSELIRNHITTNIGFSELIRMQEILRSSPRLVGKSFDLASNSILEETRGLDGAYLLRPKGGDYSLLARTAADIFNDGHVIANTAPVRVEVLNSTKTSGLAAKAAELLNKEGFQILRVSNATTQAPYPTTTIYNRSTQGHDEEANRLATLMGGHLESAIPPWVPSGADFIVVLGADAIQKLTLGTQ